MNKKLTSSGSQTLPPTWQFPLSTTYKDFTQPPIVAGDRLVCATNSTIYALDLYTGEEIKAKNEQGFPIFLKPAFDATPPLTHSRGILYFMDDDELVARQLSDGKIPMRRQDNQLVPRWTPRKLSDVVSVRASDDLVVVTQANPRTKVSGFDAITGACLWKDKLISQGSPGPIEATRDAIVFVSGGHLFAVNIRSGDTRFEFAPAGDSLSRANPPQIAELRDQAVVVIAGKSIYGVDLRTGKQLWTKASSKPTANTQWHTPAIDERYNRVVVANNESGKNVFALDLTTGVEQWSAEVRDCVQVRIVGDKVYAGGMGQNANLHVLDLASGKRLDTANFDDIGRFGFVTGHGILFSPGDAGIDAIAFGKQNAALFDGHSSRITIDAQESQFDFKQNDFTIETWICSTRGGEIVSGFPTVAGNEHHGFRLNVSEQGRVRFAIINKSAQSSFAASSAMTNVVDGSWHHVAVVRRGANVEAYVDGISVEVNTELRGPGELDVSGKNALTLGAFVAGTGANAEAHFGGLMRELRVWDIALDASKLQSRLLRVLKGTEPHLLGYWRMDESDISKLKNYVPRYVYPAKPTAVRSFVTELALDTSVFPYLLDQVKLQWPYAGHWSARGETEIASAPALERSGMMAFSVGNSLYGVHTSDGTRAWSKPTPSGASAPIAGRGCFYAVAANEGFVSIDAVTGATTRVEAFDGFINKEPRSSARIPVSAVEGRYTAAALPGGTVWIVEDPKTSDQKPTPWEWKANAPIKGDLSLVDGRLYVVAGNALFQVDPATKKASSVAVAGVPVVAHANSVFCLSATGTVVALATSDLTKKRASFTSSKGSVTGIAAWSNLDLVVVATDKGELYGLSFATLAERWSISIPDGGSSKNSLHVPVIRGRSVFCTSTSGAVAAVDALNGEFRSLFFEPTSINTAPVVDAGTIYFGCDDAPPQANLLDGALHSVVFGQTHVLRLGLDRTGKREQQPAYASITSGDILELMGVDSCCIEAWVNTQDGGEVLSIAPTAESHYGLRLWLDQNGQINFISDDSHDDAGNNWHRLTSSASSSACDGKWHHIAVSRLGSQEVIIYLDSVALTTTTKLDTIAKPSLADKLKVFIGADATASAPRNFYGGMIGEIRVWDTYLTPTRIAERMHDKLLGNEPDLLAYWNFDTLSIHDSTRFGHDGKLETSNGSSGYWLADLNFTHPTYPYLETEGRILQGGTSGDANTIFQLTIAARKADGTPLADHELTLWYVRHRGETGPDLIEIAAGTAATLAAVRPDHGADNSFKAKTGANGKAIFKIITTQLGHGPSFDVRPAFVPANERYHVNVLIDTQKLQKPAPPKLEAQAKLSQDYHWNTGDKVDHTRDRATWRTVITARSSDGRPRAGERLQLWATEHVEIEVNGCRYPINPNNYQSFVADDNGELTITLEADELRAPALSVWAGFMHRDERYTIPLDEEAHDKLGKVTGNDLAEKRKTGWKRDYNPATDDKAIVKEGYKPHAGKVATAIQHVMSVTEEPKPGMRAGLLRAKRAHLRADRRNFADMRQAPPPPRADGVTSLRTLKHVERQLPLEPENFRQSLTQTLGFENSIGFVFTKSDLELRPITAVAQVHAQFLQKAPAAPKLLGNIFEDAWDAIESAAEAVWREAQKIAIYIADQVILVIEYADRIVQKVVSSIKEAIDAVVHILKMIEAFISDVIRFLMTLFDWGAILEAHKLLKQLATQQLKEARRLVAGEKGALMKLVTGVRPTTAPIDSSSALIASRSASTCRAENPQAHAEAHVKSVQGKYVNNKVDEGGDQITYSASPSVTVGDLPIDDGATAMAGKLATTLSSALSDPLSVSFSEMYESIKALIAGDIKKVVGQLLESALPDSETIGKLFDALDLALNAPIEIPFVSQLYKWITGEQLTLLDVTCLAAAVPAHIGYAVYTLITTGEGRTLATDLRPFVTGRQSGLLAAPLDHPLAVHWCYFVNSTLYIIGSGVLKAQQIANPMGEWKKGAIRFFVPAIVYNGIYSKTLLYLRGLEEEEWDEEHLIWNSTLYGTTVALDIFTLVDTFFLGNTPAGNDRLSKMKAALRETGKLGASVVGAGLLGMRIHAWVTHRSHQSDFYQMRDVLNAVSLMFSFDDTQLFLGNPTGKKLAPYVIAGETIVKVAASAMQMAAIQAEHSHD
jgi:outer membrane protein assembly factor BamB